MTRQSIYPLHPGAGLMYTETGVVGFDFIKNDPVSLHQTAKYADESAIN